MIEITINYDCVIFDTKNVMIQYIQDAIYIGIINLPKVLFCKNPFNEKIYDGKLYVNYIRGEI